MIKKTVAMFMLIGMTVQAQVKTKVDSLVNSYLEKSGNHALLVGVVMGNTTQIFSYGKELADSNSIFELGEVTQVFTTTLLSDFIYHDIVKLDDPVQKYLPLTVRMPVHQKVVCEPVKIENDQAQENKGMDIRITPMVCYPDPKDRPNKILLCDLVTHTSGLPALPSNLKNKNYTSAKPYDQYSDKNLYDYLNNLVTINPEGIRFKYSNTSMALLGHALSYKAGKNYDELISDRINFKLKLNDTRVVLNNEQQKRLVKGFDPKNKPAESWTPLVMQGALGLHASMKDMLIFLQVNISTTLPDMKNILEQTHGSRYMVSDRKKKISAVGLGWLIKEANDKNLIHWQAGHTAGHAAFIGFCEQTKTGVVILSASAKEVDEMGLKLMEILK